MEGGINPDATLDYVEFHIFPSQNRYEASVWSSNREEKVASGLLEQLLLHSPEIKNLSSKGSNTNFKILPPDNINDACWFTTATLTRFLHIVGLPDILSIGKEISHLEETRKFELSLSDKAEVHITTSIESKNELLLAVDLRLTALKEELAAVFNHAIVSKWSPKDISDLGNFALHFRAKDLRDLLLKYVESRTIPSKSSIDDEDSTFSSEDDQPSVERSRALTRSAMPRRSSSPMRRIQIGRSGSRRAAALSIKSLNYFQSREKSMSSGEEEDSQRPPKNNVLRMSVQDKISLFESKKRDQGVEIQKTKTSNVTVGANKAILRRWSSGTLPDETSSTSPKNVASDGTIEPKTESCDETAEKGASEQLRVEVDKVEPERAESYVKHNASNEWSQQKGAELDGLFMELMESKTVIPQNMIVHNSKNKILKEQRGGSHDLYKKKREDKLQGEAVGKRIDERKTKTTTTNMTGANRRRAAANESQKPQKNSTQMTNSKTAKAYVVKKSTSKSSPLPATRKSWPPSPARTPPDAASASSTPKNRKPQSASLGVRSRAKPENLQPRLKTLNATLSDANKRIKAPNEKKQPTVTENKKTTKTKIQSPKADTIATAKPSFYNKVTRKSSVVPLETKPFLRKGPGINPKVSKTKVVAQLDETIGKSGGLIEPEENKMVRKIDITSQNQEKECEMREDHSSVDLELEVVSRTKCEGSEMSEINTTTEEELAISPAAWVVTEENHEDEIIPIQIASPAIVTKPVGFSSQRVRHSLSQILLEDNNETDIGEWGNAEHPPTMVYQKDAPRGLKRLLKFARKAKADSHLTGWSSPSAFSEGEDDADEPPKATRSFFSLSAFRGNKTNETKPLHR